MKKATTTAVPGRFFLLLAMVIATMAGASARAETLYRCGPDGREFSQKPCADGARVDASPRTPSASEVAAARDVAARDAKLAQQLQRENEARNAQRGAKAGAINGLAAAPASSSASAAKGKKKRPRHHQPSAASSATDGDFRAVSPQPSKKDRKSP